ncbi:MAG: hypothetical protein EA425_02075 [Puniceicoccaceae bacterium]|nr:MAG: hypothetical protein EA425_02075 [Puniceicoccaceae bacterium]
MATPTSAPLGRILGCSLLFILSAAALPAADLLRISPVTDRILLLEFGEGHIRYAGLGENWQTANRIDHRPLDLERATDPAHYTLTSPNDSAFGENGETPVHLGRKSKGHLFHDLYAYNRGDPDYLSRHSIYLQLPHPLRSGKTYTLHLDNLASNSNHWLFTFDEAALRSETIHVNQVGFRPAGPKIAYLSQFMGDFHHGPHQNGGLDLSDYEGAAFRLVRMPDGEEVFQGTLAPQQPKTAADSAHATDFGPHRNFSNADVWEADFSAFTGEGVFRVVVDRMGASFPFRIGANVYREAYVTAMRGIFLQRSGIHREVREYNDLVYPGGHRANAMYYQPNRMRVESGPQDQIDRSRPVTDIWGWYHDAGDWDGYQHSHWSVPAALLLAYHLGPEKFVDGGVGNRWKHPGDAAWVEEAGSGRPDILDEAAWLIEFMRRARQALIAQGHGTGGVPAYVGIDGGGPTGTTSWTDTRDLVLHREDPGVTGIYAGLAATFAKALETAGRPTAEVDDWIAEAEAAYTWAKANDGPSEELEYGAAGLYFATGDPSYQSDYLGWRNLGMSWDTWAATGSRHHAAFLYAILPPDHDHLDTEAQTAQRQRLAEEARNLWVNPGLQRGFRATHISSFQRNFLGIFSTPRTMMAAVAHHVNGEEDFARAVQFAADYTLGGNPMSQVWMTGLGWRAEEQPFHLDSWALLDLDHPVYVNPILPGITPYGSHFTFDWFGENYQHSGSEDFSRSSAHPVIWRKTGSSHGGRGPAWQNPAQIPDWAPSDSVGDGPKNETWFPAAEQRFQNRYSIAGSEFTMHQNLAHTAFTYAHLMTAPEVFSSYDRPQITLDGILGEHVGRQALQPLRVEASDDVAEVRYYRDGRFIGSSADREDRFAVYWRVADHPVETGATVRITATARAWNGRPTLPTEAAERTVTIVDGEGAFTPLESFEF